MRIGYQGEPYSYSHRAGTALFPDDELVGLHSFVECFERMQAGDVDRLVLPVENSTTGSVLPVLDRLPTPGGVNEFSIIAEHLEEIRHALLGLPGTELGEINRVKSHVQALSQAEALLLHLGIEPVPVADTAGAVREVAAEGDPTVGALAPPEAAAPHGLVIIKEQMTDRHHNTTRFVVLAPGEPQVDPDDDKTTMVFTTGHTPGALALALTELGLRGANLTRIESRPSNEAWTYRFFVDLVHPPGAEGLRAIVEPVPSTLDHLQILGSYRSVAG